MCLLKILFVLAKNEKNDKVFMRKISIISIIYHFLPSLL